MASGRRRAVAHDTSEREADRQRDSMFRRTSSLPAMPSPMSQSGTPLASSAKLQLAVGEVAFPSSSSHGPGNPNQTSPKWPSRPTLLGTGRQLGNSRMANTHNIDGSLTSSYYPHALRGDQRSASVGRLGVVAVSEVSALTLDTPRKGGEEAPKSFHEALKMRLKSSTALREAEVNRTFLTAYQSGIPSPRSEEKLDALLKSTADRAEQLRKRADEMHKEVLEAERKVERTNALKADRATETELQAMNPFEQAQRKIRDDKREEELKSMREEVQDTCTKLHRRWQGELVEVRDYKVLLREFKRLRLEKLYETLNQVRNGQQLRTCIREMIRHGAQRILQKLDAAMLPLEPWMCEVLVNSCHLEMRIEQAEERLLGLRRESLKPVKQDVESMLSQTKQERFESLCVRTWENRLGHLRDADVGACSAESTSAADAPASGNTVTEMRSTEADIAALRRLLQDMRYNTAVVVCNRVRQAQKAGGQQAGREASAWGSTVLALLVSEEFAFARMKEMQKSAPSSKYTC